MYYMYYKYYFLIKKAEILSKTPFLAIVFFRLYAIIIKQLVRNKKNKTSADTNKNKSSLKYG